MACAFRTWGQHRVIVSSEIKYLHGERDGAHGRAVSTKFLKRHPIENVATSLRNGRHLRRIEVHICPARSLGMRSTDKGKQEPIARRLVRLALEEHECNAHFYGFSGFC
jgi:hypothetical protein